MMNLLQKFLSLFLADEGTYEPAGIPSVGYFILMFVTFFCIYKALKKTLAYSYTEIRKIIRRMITVLWGLEIFKIGYRFYYGYASDLGTWVPLYFCSITLFAGLLSSYATGVLQHIGDVFIAVGGLIGGICFLLYPSTSLLLFPAWHFLSIQSFLYHGSMTYLGILVNRSGLVELKKSDLKYYAGYVFVFCLLAQGLNLAFGSNLMFTNKPFEASILVIMEGMGRFYTPFMFLVQMFVPFYVIMWFRKNTNLLTRPTWYPVLQEKHS